MWNSRTTTVKKRERRREARAQYEKTGLKKERPITVYIRKKRGITGGTGLEHICNPAETNKPKKCGSSKRAEGARIGHENKDERGKRQ